MADHGGASAPAKVNKPSNSNFRQQRLVAWQPIMSPPHVVACLFLVFLAFTPIGIAIFFANEDAISVEYRYDDRRGVACSLTNNDGLFTFSHNNGVGANVSMGCQITIQIDIKKEMKAPVYLYYKLTNFYQNHRRFAKSRSVSQLAGDNPSSSSMSDCDPLLEPGKTLGLSGTEATVDGQTRSYGSMKYSPCGLVAWSLFNDSFTLVGPNNQVICDGSRFDKGTNAPLPGAGNCTKKGITWASDEEKFKLPAFGSEVWTANRSYYPGAPALATSDPFIANGWYAGEPGHEVPVVSDEDLQVWMRTAALPDFRKLYRVINVDLPAGTYYMVIREFFPVGSFGGTKSFALSTLSWLGGENSFLAIAYVVVGGVSFLLAVVFFIVYRINGDRMQQAIDSLSELQ